MQKSGASTIPLFQYYIGQIQRLTVPAVIYATQANGLSVMTDWTIRLNAVMDAIGLASSRTAVLVCEFCTKSAIGFWFLPSGPWAEYIFVRMGA